MAKPLADLPELTGKRSSIPVRENVFETGDRGMKFRHGSVKRLMEPLYGNGAPLPPGPAFHGGDWFLRKEGRR